MTLNATTAPYYKVQEWNKKSLAWVDVQQSYESYQEAVDNGHGQQGVDFRVMKIQGNKRGVVGQP